MVRECRDSKPSVGPRMRIRDLLPNIFLGNHSPGPLNSLTDVPGISVSTQELASDNGSINTGVTCIIPRKDWSHKACYAGTFSFNGYGEMTGVHLISEGGLLCSPIVFTGTFGIGAAHQGILEYGVKTFGRSFMALPVVAETFDGHLHDCCSFAVTPALVVKGLRDTNLGVAAATGHKIPDRDETFTVACIVQANYGVMDGLRIAGVPVGRILAHEIQQDEKRRKEKEELEKAKQDKDGSIIIIIATDAPLLPHQLTRIAKRATVGLSRVGGVGYNMSGDIFLAFSAANEILVNQPKLEHGSSKTTVERVEAVEDSALSWLFEGTADCVEEAIYNGLFMAETMEGVDRHKVEALPLQRVKDIVIEYGSG
ncbi:L-aminopeptidase/D-esterase [Aureobasidium subglaciale]|nr:L-aminopeptidase/D-esterase [Aureobasidium subglaciale]